MEAENESVNSKEVPVVNRQRTLGPEASNK